MQVLPPLMLTAGLAVGLWWWTPLYHHRPTPRLLAALLGTSALIVWLQLALGIVRALTPLALGVTAFAVIVVLNGGYWLWGRRFLQGRADPIAKPTKIGIALGAAAAVVHAWIAWVGSLIPPWAWDTLTYHLTDVLYMARTRSLDIFPVLVGGGVQFFFFPQAGELHSSWFYILSGAGESSYRVAGFGLMWLPLTAAVAARAAVEALGMRAALPWIAPAVLLTPAVVSQAIELYVDSAFAAFVLAAFAFVLWADRESRFPHLAFAALASGLAFGVKLSFLYFSLPILVAAFFSRRVWAVLTKERFPVVAGRIAIVVALFVSGFGFWLGRNWIEYGNPFWPTRLEIAGTTIFEGPISVPHGPQARWYVPTTAHWLIYPFYETYHGETRYSGNGFGPLFAAGYVSLLLALPLAIARRQGRLARALLALPLTLVAYVALSPTEMPRYIIASVGFGLVALAVVVEMIAYGWRAATSGEEQRAAAVPNRLPFRVVTVAAMVAFAFSALGSTVIVSDDLERVLPRWRSGSWKPEEYYRFKYGSAGNTFNWIAQNGGPNVTFTLTNSTFVAPVLGWHNRNRVVHARLPGDPKLGPEKRVSNYAGWRKFLRDEKVTYIVRWVPWWGESSDRPDEMWIDENPADFELVEDFGRAKIYRPVFTGRPEPVDTLPELARLNDGKNWKLEYRTGAETSSAEAPGGVRIDYAFGTTGNDYCVWRTRILCDDWSKANALSFDLDAARQGSYLILYLKNSDPAEGCRFRIDLRNIPATRGRVRIPLRGPEWRSDRFDLTNICEIHVVLDDVDDASGPRGSIALTNFALDSSNRSPGGAQ